MPIRRSPQNSHSPLKPCFPFLQLEGDTITLKPRPSADLTNSSAPSPSHKVQRSVSANPKQRRSSDQGMCSWESQVRDTFILNPYRFFGYASYLVYLLRNSMAMGRLITSLHLYMKWSYDARKCQAHSGSAGDL